jgi:hypothetical protein
MNCVLKRHPQTKETRTLDMTPIVRLYLSALYQEFREFEAAEHRSRTGTDVSHDTSLFLSQFSFVRKSSLHTVQH